MDWKVVAAGVRDVLWDWDPIGVANVAPDDEYDCMVAALVGQLISGADQAEIAEFLQRELGAHFGLSFIGDQVEPVAGTLIGCRAVAVSSVE